MERQSPGNVARVARTPSSVAFDLKRGGGSCPVLFFGACYLHLHHGVRFVASCNCMP